MTSRYANAFRAAAAALALWAAGAERAVCADTTVEAAGTGADEDAAIRDAAATALTEIFQTLLAQADVTALQAPIAAFVAADTAKLAANAEPDDGAIRRIEVAKAVSEDERARVTARFTVSLDYLTDEIAQLHPGTGQPGELWICPILGRCGPPGTPGLGSWVKTRSP